MSEDEKDLGPYSGKGHQEGRSVDHSPGDRSALFDLDVGDSRVLDEAVTKRRFSKAEVSLARRIKDKVDREEWEKACAPPAEETIREQMMRILDAPLQPLYGPTPPWWEQAVAEADQGMVWVRGGGWMKKSLWEDILFVSEEMKCLEKECDDDD